MNMRWLCVQVLLAFGVSVNAIGFRGLHFKGLEDPKWIGPRTINQKWIEQPLDHFNHRDTRTWKMRYYQEDKYFNGSGPIFVMLGGEWAINPGFLQSGLMHDIAREHGGLMFYTEHRYYGQSKPTKNLSSDNLQYLSVDQALADVAYFLDSKKAEFNISDSKVIVFGGSYAGNMAAWIRIKYPHLIQGAVASSAPVYAKADFYEYYEVVTRSLASYDEQCARDVGQAFEETEKLLASEEGPDKIKSLFRLCNSPVVDKDVVFFMTYLAESFAGTVQYNNYVNNQSAIGALCDKMIKSNKTSLVERLADMVLSSSGSGCNKIEYNQFVEFMRSVDWTYNIMRQWYFQTCTEFGYYQTANSSLSGFGTLIDLDFYVSMCNDVYGDYYGTRVLSRGVSRTNIHYGGRLPDVTHVIFVNGDVDPWHALSVLEDLNDKTPAILVHGTSHCQDLQPDTANDLPAMREARSKIKQIVAGWIAE